jgi:ankyrin repeat protein
MNAVGGLFSYFFKSKEVPEKATQTATAEETPDQQLCRYIRAGNQVAMKRLLMKKVPLHDGCFETICFSYPAHAKLAIKNYPDLAKNASFGLLGSLCRRVTHQDVSNYAVPDGNDPSPTTEDVLIDLLDAGASPAGTDTVSGYTLLHFAIENGLARAAERMIDCPGIDSLAALRSGVTPLHLAAQDGTKFERVINKLVRNKLAVSKITKAGATPLHYAATARSISAVNILLASGADRAVQDVFKRTAQDVARLYPGNEAVIARLGRSNAGEALCKWDVEGAVKFLKAGETITDEDVVDCCRKNFTSVFQQLLCQYPQVVSQLSDSLLVKLLKSWAFVDFKELSELCMKLIDCGIGVRGRHPLTSETALHLATQNHVLDLAIKLLSKGADAMAQDALSRTPLHHLRLEDFGVLFPHLTDIHRVFFLSLLRPEVGSDIINDLFVVDVSHITKEGLKSVNIPDCEPQDLTRLVSSYKKNFSFMSGVVITLNGNYANAQVIPELVENFLDKVNKETPFHGTPKEKTQALQDYYRTIRNCLYHVVAKLSPTWDQENTYYKVSYICLKLAEASGECGNHYLETALDLYNTYCLDIRPTFSTAFYEQFQLLRGLVCEDMLNEPYVNKHQTSHALHYIKRRLGDVLQLYDRDLYKTDDALAINGFTDYKLPTDETVVTSFFKRYTPAMLCQYMYDLLEDARYRGFYMKWAQENLHEIAPGYRPGRAVTVERQGEINGWIFDEITFKPNRAVLLLALLKLGIIKVI